MVRLNVFYGLLLLSLWFVIAIIQPLHAESCSIGNYRIENVEKKIGIALVIGNSKYQSRILKYPVKDAVAIAHVLKDIGFSVASFQELKTKGEFNSITRSFKDCLKISNNLVAFFYYSGHGTYLVDEKANFLIPIYDVDIQDRADVESDSFSVKKLFSRLKEADNKINIVILDACRKHPHLNFSKGLGDMQRFYDLILAYPTKYGKTIAPIAHPKNSLYVKHFIKELKSAYKNGIEVKDFLDKISNQVQEKSGKRQYPIVRPLRKTFFCWGKPCPGEGLDNNLDARVEDEGDIVIENRSGKSKPRRGFRGGH
jgi:hypothetical protein